MIHLIGDMSVPINHLEMIFFGKGLIQLKPNNKKGTIKVINLEDKSNTENKEFTYKNDTVTIGRGENCDIPLVNSDSDVSKIQCSLYYSNEDKLWMIRDGYKDKRSTNGTWLTAPHSYPLFNDMEIEVFSNILKINYY